MASRRRTPSRKIGQWPSAIPPEGYQAYKDTLKLLTELLPRMKGSILSGRFRPFLDVELEKGVELPISPEVQREVEVERKRLKRQHDRFDPLLIEFRNWAQGEFRPQRKDVIKIEGLAFSYRVPIWSSHLAGCAKEIVALVANGLTASELVALTRKGDKKSLLALIRLDKVFLTSRLAKAWILQAQSREHVEFFKALAKAVTRDSYRENIRPARRGIACILLWYLGFERLGKRRLLEFVEAEGLADYPDPKTFDRFLSRIGLRIHSK